MSGKEEGGRRECVCACACVSAYVCVYANVYVCVNLFSMDVSGSRRYRKKFSVIPTTGCYHLSLQIVSYISYSHSHYSRCYVCC